MMGLLLVVLAACGAAGALIAWGAYRLLLHFFSAEPLTALVVALIVAGVAVVAVFFKAFDGVEWP